jgi:hypothetical protein
MASKERLEIRAIIKFCQKEGETPSKIDKYRIPKESPTRQN